MRWATLCAFWALRGWLSSQEMPSKKGRTGACPKSNVGRSLSSEASACENDFAQRISMTDISSTPVSLCVGDELWSKEDGRAKRDRLESTLQCNLNL